jgi:hypothetical protein
VFSGGFKVLYHREDIFAKEFLARSYSCLMEINQPSPVVENSLNNPMSAVQQGSETCLLSHGVTPVISTFFILFLSY